MKAMKIVIKEVYLKFASPCIIIQFQ